MSETGIWSGRMSGNSTPSKPCCLIDGSRFSRLRSMPAAQMKVLTPNFTRFVSSRSIDSIASAAGGTLILAKIFRGRPINDLPYGFPLYLHNLRE